jgi:hypothetical protein
VLPQAVFLAFPAVPVVMKTLDVDKKRVNKPVKKRGSASKKDRTKVPAAKKPAGEKR